jgi:hypothetical protein
MRFKMLHTDAIQRLSNLVHLKDLTVSVHSSREMSMACSLPCNLRSIEIAKSNISGEELRFIQRQGSVTSVTLRECHHLTTLPDFSAHLRFYNCTFHRIAMPISFKANRVDLVKSNITDTQIGLLFRMSQISFLHLESCTGLTSSVLEQLPITLPSILIESCKGIFPLRGEEQFPSSLKEIHLCEVGLCESDLKCLPSTLDTLGLYLMPTIFDSVVHYLPKSLTHLKLEGVQYVTPDIVVLARVLRGSSLKVELK